MRESKKTPRFTDEQLLEIGRSVTADVHGYGRVAIPAQTPPTQVSEVAPQTKPKKTKKVFSLQARKNISEAQARRFQSEEARMQISIARGGIRERAYPWFARGALTKDVTSLTGLTTNQASNARRLLRAADRIPTPDADQTRKNKARAHEPESVAFRSPVLIRLVRILTTKNFLVKDGSEFNNLTQLYESSDRPLNNSFIFRVILEAYSTALKNKNAFAIDLVEAAVQTANLADQFKSEFQFLKSRQQPN